MSPFEVSTATFNCFKWSTYFFPCFFLGCNGNMTNSSGFIFSPHFPGYYPPLTLCRWTIKVAPGKNIKLRFLEFQLEDHPSCYSDYIEVYDGYETKTKKLLGRYCGLRFPDFLESSTNVMLIKFVSNDKVTRSGFKMHYTSEEGKGLLSSSALYKTFP